MHWPVPFNDENKTTDCVYDQMLIPMTLVVIIELILTNPKIKVTRNMYHLPVENITHKGKVTGFLDR